MAKVCYKHASIPINQMSCKYTNKPDELTFKCCCSNTRMNFRDYFLIKTINKRSNIILPNTGQCTNFFKLIFCIILKRTLLEYYRLVSVTRLKFCTIHIYYILIRRYNVYKFLIICLPKHHEKQFDKALSSQYFHPYGIQLLKQMYHLTPLKKEEILQDVFTCISFSSTKYTMN